MTTSYLNMAANLSGADDVRRNSAGAVEITDGKGRRRTVQLEELSAADRDLAEKFGYKPVSIIIRRRPSSFLT